MNKTLYILALAFVCIALSGCSTTKRLGEGEVLYTGVKKMEIENVGSEDVPKSVVSDVKAPLSVKPNNPLYSPYIRTPFPIGLWAYNHLYTEKKSGLKAWLYKRLAKEPVTISKVQPELRLKVVEQILDNNGYFGSTSSYELLPHKNPKKARISYFVNIPDPWLYDSVRYLSAAGDIGRIIDSMSLSAPMHRGDRYILDTLSNERVRITNTLRDRGYYYFRPDYVLYEADTTRQHNKVDLRMVFADNIPEQALKTYRVGDINLTILNNLSGELDTLTQGGIHIRYEKPLKVRRRVIERNIGIKSGDLYTVKAQNATQGALNRLGVFRYVNLNVVPLDSLGNSDLLDVNIEASMELPLEAQFEADFTSKSNSFIGPGAIFQVKHNNFFRGGEVFTVRLNGSYEWQTGNKRQIEGESGLVNSYELGLNTSLSIPEIVPRIFGRSKWPTRTTFRLGADLMNRPGFFRMLSLNTSAGYDFQTSRSSYHTVTPFKLVYNNLLSTSESFDQTMAENPAVQMSFQNQFIPSMGYAYTYDKTFGSHKRNRFLWQNNFTSAGNILSGAMSLFGNTGNDKKLFGSKFSQFVKLTTDGRFYRNFGSGNSLVIRLMAGAGYAYGNSEVMPYSEQFYIGGANSIRAFTIRTLGPGSYHPSVENKNSYLDQVGDFKLEANIEFRFGIANRLSGAVFVDAGNIWLIKEDENRPGGKLEFDSGLWKEIALGTGVGLRFDISYLVIRADLGVGIHTPYENPEKSGYYNVPSFKKSLGFHLAIGYPF